MHVYFFFFSLLSVHWPVSQAVQSDYGVSSSVLLCVIFLLFCVCVGSFFFLGPGLPCELLQLGTVCVGSGPRPVRLRRRGRLGAPPAPDAAAYVDPGGAQQPQRVVEEQAGLPHPGLAAAARRHAVAAVLLEVAVQVVRAHESLAAARALVGPQAGVYTHVVLQVVVVGEGGATLRAQVRLLSCMLPHVNLELVLPEEEGRERGEERETKQGQNKRRR